MKRNGTSTAFTLAGFLLMLFIWTGCEKDKFETKEPNGPTFKMRF